MVFSPKPATHHVRWIEPDVNNKKYIFVAIEAGALIKSLDGGRTWIDKVESGPYDTHTLRTHKKASQRLYSAAGDGYFESYDYGNTWKTFEIGLSQHTYLSGVAVNSADPQNIIVSAATVHSKHILDKIRNLLYIDFHIMVRIMIMNGL